MKIAVIGLGDIAQKAYLPVITSRSDLELVFCSRNAETLTTLANQYRIKHTCQNYQELLSMNIDAVMIHAATKVHYEIAAFFLSHGVATFVDKPLVDNAADVERLYTLAAQTGQPLYVGFNRRHLPLFNQTVPEFANQELGQLRSLRWEKHRFGQPGDVRTFIFDDFIHPLDSVNLNAQADLNGLDIRVQRHGTQLARLDVTWQSGETLLAASMNRQFGTTHERVSVEYENRALEFDSFVEGREWRESQERRLALKDWTPMLASKGFTHMIDDWVDCVNQGRVPQGVIERNIASHRLAEALCQKVENHF